MAGVLIGAWGVSFAFYANAISFLAVTFACVLVRVRPPALGSRGASVGRQLRAGARYVRSNAAVFRLTTLVGVLTFLMMHSTLMPVFATKVLHGGARPPTPSFPPLRASAPWSASPWRPASSGPTIASWAW